MLVTFVIDTSASMNQSTSSGMTLLDFAKSAVERFVKRVRDPSRRYQHHFMLISCGSDNAVANRNFNNSSSNNGSEINSNSNHTPPWNGRVRVGWDQSTNKDAFLSELKNLRANDLSDVGSALKQAFELMNQIRLQFNWDNYGLGRTPWNTNVAVCILITDATVLSMMDGMIQDTLTIAPSSAVGAELTHEPYRWDQRLFTIALKLSATMTGVKSQSTVPTDLMALSEATGGMLYLPTSKSAVEQSIDQIILKLKAGAVVKFKCDVAESDADASPTRNVISPIPNGKEYCWPVAESFWLDRNTVSLPSRDAHPVLVYRRTVETAIEAATNHMLLDTLKFPADNYMLETSLNPAPPRGQRWLVYVQGSKGDGRLGDPIGFLRATPPSGSSSNIMLVLLPYNFPALFTLLVEAARVYQASGQNISSASGTWMFQAKAMPSSWRELFTSYISGCPIYYYAPLKKVLRKYNLHDMVPEVQDSGRSYQISNYLNRLRDQSITESENNNKLYARLAAKSGGVPDTSPSATSSRDNSSDFSLDAVANMSLQDLLKAHQKSKRSFFDKPFRNALQLPLPRISTSKGEAPSNMRLAPSFRAAEEDEKHRQPIDVMSDYESRLIKKEALRNPLGDPEPDEDTPAGIRRRQLCFNLGNPYKKNATKVRVLVATEIVVVSLPSAKPDFLVSSHFLQQQVSNVYQGEAADEAAALGGQSPKRQRTRKRSSQLKREKKQAKRSHRPPSSPSFASSPGSPSRSPKSPSSGSSVTSSPGMSESGDSVVSVSTVGSNYSVKAETAQMLGIPLHDGNFTEEGQDKSFVRSVYGVLVENWESWSTILRLIKARTIIQQEQEFIMNALRSMRGGEVVVRTYIQQAIQHSKQFKKSSLVAQMQQLLEEIAPEDESKTSADEAADYSLLEQEATS